MSYHFWTGIWAMVFLLVALLMDISSLLRELSQFSLECFQLSYVVWFVYYAFKHLHQVGWVPGVFIAVLLPGC